jgi:hypothetical protein
MRPVEESLRLMDVGAFIMATSDRWAVLIAGFGKRAAEHLRRDEKDDRPDDRRSYLPRVLPIGPQEIEDPGEDAARNILRRLAAALRSERARGRAGHWSYDLNRHVALMQAYNAERRRLVQLAGVRRFEGRKTGA